MVIPQYILQFYWDMNAYTMGDLANYVEWGYLTEKGYEEIVAHGYTYPPSDEEALMYLKDIPDYRV